MAESLGDLLDYLTRDERDELDEHLTQLGPYPHAAYRRDPIGWARDKLAIPEYTMRWALNPGYDRHVWDGTPDPIAALFEAVAAGERAVAVESATGTGKSFAGAVLVLWFLACWEDALVITHALNEKQLELFIWSNITKLWPQFVAHFPTATRTALTIRMRGGIDETWAAHGRAVQLRAGEDVATRAAGYHAEHLLILYEEAAGQDWSVIEAGRNTCTAPHNIRVALGNPNYQLDSLHRFATERGTVHIRASALDHPNVVLNNASIVPGAASAISIAERRERFGEHDPVYQSRVRGISPEQASNALIRLEWLKAARDRWLSRANSDNDTNAPSLPTAPIIGLVSRNAALYPETPHKVSGDRASNAPVVGLPTRVTGKGVDVANSEHGDRACIVDFCDNVWCAPRAFQCPDANRLGADVVAEARRHDLPPRRVGVDAIGVGAGTVNEARRLGFVVHALYAGGLPMPMIEKAEDGRDVEWSPDVNLFKNLRAQMYWQAREDLRKGLIDGPEDAELWAELTAPTFSDNNKVVELESKDDIRERLGRSPDKADAFVMANWVRHRIVEAPESVPAGAGRTAGYDFTEQRPREKVSPEQELERMLQRAQPNLIGNRYSIPNRRGR